jgi:ATP-dependent Clp protease ATP-binding subunit ClpB
LIQEKLQVLTDVNKDEIMGEIKVRLVDMLKATIRPEFLNRIDEIILFNPLTPSDIRKIVDIQINLLKEKLERNNIGLVITDDAKDWLGKVGFDIVYGARPLKRIIQKYITNPLSERILSAEFLPGDTVVIALDHANKIEFRKE